MTLGEEITVTERCEKVLKDYGASPGLRKFCLEIIEYEQEISGATLRMHEKLRQLNEDGTQCMDTLTPLIESMREDFLMWNRAVESLAKRGNSLPPLLAAKLHGRKLQVAAAIRTKTLPINEGDFVTVIDTSKPNIIKVRAQDGKEDYLPILTFILQSTDETVSRLLQRLLVQLLSLWTDCLTRTGKLLLRSALDVFHSSNLSKRDFEEVEVNGASIISRVRKFGDVLRRTEKESIMERKVGKANIQNQELVRNSLKTITSYEEFFDHWNNFRKKLKDGKPHPICIFESLDDFRKHSSEDDGRVKCFTTTFVVESTEVREETVHVPLGDYDDDDDASSFGAGASWKQSIETEQLTSISQEEKKRYIIKAVRDPRRGGEGRISLRDAVQVGIMDMEHGIYTNPDTRESIPIAVALSEGDIQVDYVTRTRSVPKTEALGLITIRDRIDSKGYAIQGAIDALTAEKVDLAESKRRGLIDEDATHFTVSTTGERIDMQDAVETGWVLVDYDDPDDTGNGDPEFRSRTYVVRAVVDQRLKKRVPFLEAINRRLIDRESGNYHNNMTGETIHVLEAIRRGFLKAKIVDDPSTLDIDPTNKMVVQSINKMKRLVTGLSALSAMKESASRLSSTSSNTSA